MEQQYKIRLPYQERGHMGEDEGMRHMSEKAILDILAPFQKISHEEGKNPAG